jgi:hypothetical protein
MKEVNEICAHMKVDTGNHLPKKEGSTERTAPVTESVHVISGVISNDSHEPM